MKAKISLDAEGRFYGITFNCPGCGDSHQLPVHWCPPGMVSHPYASGTPMWSFNGDLERPTLKPSILAKSGHHAREHKPGESCWCTWEAEEGEPSPFSCYICHSFVTGGRIQFLDDCTHALAGQTVDLPEIEVADER